MAVDTKLASGLTDRYLREMTVSAYNAINKADVEQFDVRDNVYGWKKNILLMKKWYGEGLICSHSIECKKQSAWYGVFAVCDEKSLLKRWDERCFTFCLTKLTPGRSPISGSEDTYLEISAHAIKRILERTNLGFSFESGFSRSEITNLLKTAPNWAGLYVTLGSASRNGETLFPVVPTPHGMFFGERHGETGAAITLRTFVSTTMLSEEQLNVYRILLRVWGWLKEVPFFLGNTYAIAPLSDERGPDDSLAIWKTLDFFRMLWFWKLGNDWPIVRDMLSEGPEHRFSQEIAAELQASYAAAISRSSKERLEQLCGSDESPNFNKTYFEVLETVKRSRI